MEQPQTITIDNLVYEVQSLTPQVQELIGANKRWNGELQKQRALIADAQMEINKLNLALTGLNNEIIRQVRDSGIAPIKDLTETQPEGSETGC